MSCTGWDWTKQNRAKWPVILRCRSNYHNVYLHFYLYMFVYASRSQWPRRRRRGFTFTRLLGLRVRIPTGHLRLSLVSVVYCQVEFYFSGWSLVQRSPIVFVVSECDHEASITMGPGPIGDVVPWKKDEKIQKVWSWNWQNVLQCDL